MSSLRNSIAVFHDRYPLVGPIVWALSMQYFVTQYIVARDWSTPFSLRYNTISDLGNTACGLYNGRYICSPLHAYMNASFILLGLFMMAGAVLIHHEFTRSQASRAGFASMAVAGFGTVFVGLFPENTISALHIGGAALPFLFGNIAMVVLGLRLELPRWLAVYSVMSGVVGLAGLVAFLAGLAGPLGTGGMERVVAYPQSLWLIVFGLYMFRDRFVQVASARRVGGERSH